ncbi:hypothetical protein Rsub_03445 [Raphidocelis subcapitata]|uniref:Uncharacterized protein n=1 Tax=Raphidocelis subcapitata TaxID=307507 RepID=A0A2V0NT06_9CHLO|nr:hypothetical protein Rsub_03445 [Raphidocelis subcapitata]|eukprot:GBF90449.1 hypothetical protein Rsub_03445 [Raphidocelis subcapitata]
MGRADDGPGGAWPQQPPPPGDYYSPPQPSAPGLPLSSAALQPSASFTPGGYAWAAGPGGAPYAAPGYAAPAPRGGPSAPLLVPVPPGGGGGGGFYSSYGAGAPQEEFAMGHDIMYASRAMRHSFLRKVLGLVAAQLCLTAAIAAPILLLPGPRAWLGANRWAVPLAAAAAFGTLLVLVCSEGARRAYPTNLFLLAGFTAAQGVLVGVACASYNTPTVLWAVVMTACVCVLLVGYALQTKYDFTASGGMLFSALVTLLLVTLASSLLRLPALDLIISGCGALVFSCYLVYDIQLLVSGDHAVSVSVDEPIVAALNIYTDIINLFLYILQLLARDED